jgi:hypothetical protein
VTPLSCVLGYYPFGIMSMKPVCRELVFQMAHTFLLGMHGVFEYIISNMETVGYKSLFLSFTREALKPCKMILVAYFPPTPNGPGHKRE